MSSVREGRIGVDKGCWLIDLEGELFLEDTVFLLSGSGSHPI